MRYGTMNEAWLLFITIQLGRQRLAEVRFGLRAVYRNLTGYLGCNWTTTTLVEATGRLEGRTGLHYRGNWAMADYGLDWAIRRH
ncbi:hypothetical protein Hamer_G001619 [Homarus americanus]|uniref:Uncharacterized protein n=1 Tax=Homarus americanus TaxID=6706 RepID=A0A8J5JQC8_HOMAM|nr:hypothetical protein Hamer_G001619 [Homarus americanus]